MLVFLHTIINMLLKLFQSNLYFWRTFIMTVMNEGIKLEDLMSYEKMQVHLKCFLTWSSSFFEYDSSLFTFRSTFSRSSRRSSSLDSRVSIWFCRRPAWLIRVSKTYKIAELDYSLYSQSLLISEFQSAIFYLFEMRWTLSTKHSDTHQRATNCILRVKTIKIFWLYHLLRMADRI